MDLAEPLGLWARVGPMELVDGVIRPTRGGEHRYYSLQGNFNLPLYFSRVKTADDALRFACKYGLLGYDKLVETSSRRGGDPVDWVLAQARTVALAWSLIGAAAQENWPKAISILEEHAAFSKTWGPYLLIAHGAKVVPVFHLESEEAWANEPRGIVNRVLANLINNNTKGVSYALEATRNGLYRFVGVRTLIEGVWWFVSQAALQRQEDSGQRLRLAHCVACGSPFVATSGRQRYCPPPTGSRQSLCSLRVRARRWYNKHKRASSAETSGKESGKESGSSLPGKG